MKNLLLLLLLVLGGTDQLIAQPFLLSFGDNLVGEKGIVAHVMPDESLWLFGVTDVGFLGGSDIIYTRRDIQGNIINGTRNLGSSDLDYPNNMIVNNGKMIIVGEVFGNAGGDATVVVMDTSGGIVSRGQYGVPNQSEQFYDVKATADGGFIVTGFGTQPNSVANDILVSKFDQNYQQEWLRIYDLGTNEIGMAVVERPTGGYFVTGDQLQPNGNYNVILLAIDSLGNQLWDSTITNPYNGGCKQMKLYQDQIIIVGEMATSTSTAFDPYIIRLNLEGQVQIQRTIPQTNNGDAIFDLVIQDANTYFLTGYSYNPATASTDMVLMVVDSMTQVLDTRYYGGSSFDMAYDIQLLPNNEVVMVGFSGIQNDNQVFVVKDNLSNVLTAPTISKAKHSSLSIAPNPVTNTLQILDLPQGNLYQASIYNGLGQVIWKGALPANHQLELQYLPKGYYYLQINHQQQTWTSAFCR